MANFIVSSNFHRNQRLVNRVAIALELSDMLAQAHADYKTLINDNPSDFFWPAQYMQDIESIQAQLKALGV